MAIELSQFIFKNIGVPKFESYLDLAAYRQKLTAGNIANVSTPGYRSRSIDFQAEFARLSGETRQVAGSVTNPAHIPLGQHQDRAPDVDEARRQPDELNAVDIDKEVAAMAQNELHYTIAAKLLQKKFAGLRKAISG